MQLQPLLGFALFSFRPNPKRYRMIVDPRIPAATGSVEVRRNKAHGNTELRVKVASIAKPERLTPPENVYIVWVRPLAGGVQKEGILRVGQNLKGELRATTTEREADVFITAEPSENVTGPSGTELLQAHIHI